MANVAWGNLEAVKKQEMNQNVGTRDRCENRWVCLWVQSGEIRTEIICQKHEH